MNNACRHHSRVFRMANQPEHAASVREHVTVLLRAHGVCQCNLHEIQLACGTTSEAIG